MAQTPENTPTTTHATWGAGDPHLIVARIDDEEAPHTTFALREDRVRIGSAADAELVLEATDSVHAQIVHDERDEYVLTLFGEGEMNAGPFGADGPRTEILRTGARFTLGPWRLVFSRAEFADHGRPFGGREGGEGEHQKSQPPRPEYTPRGEWI